MKVGEGEGGAGEEMRQAGGGETGVQKMSLPLVEENKQYFSQNKA